MKKQLSKERELIEDLHKLFDLEIKFHKKLSKYYDAISTNEDYMQTKEFKFFEVADMVQATHTKCNALSLMRAIALEIEREKRGIEK